MREEGGDRGEGPWLWFDLFSFGVLRPGSYQYERFIWTECYQS